MNASTITRILAEWEPGDGEALSRIVRPMYEELRRAAGSCLRREWRNGTLCATALVHEAYLALANGSPVRCNGRGHFAAIVTRLMHRIVIQHARRRGALKRGGAAQAVALDEGLAATPNDTDHLDLETALQRLRCRRPRRHLIVEMHYRGGYTVEEIAAAIGAFARSVERELSAGRTWLKEQMPSAS